MSDWKDLEIGNIPSDFFINKRYEIHKMHSSSEWEDSSYSKVGQRHDIIKVMGDYGDKYRYKLKPLKPCVITEHMARDLRARVVNGNYDSLEDLYGRPVEIIKDGE